MRIGLVGKPNVGKSTFFSAATLAQVDIANYPFCTIDPNVGVAFVEARLACPCQDLRKKLEADGRLEPPRDDDPREGSLCEPRTGTCIGHRRSVPVALVDVAGLVPGASEGRGRGNAFLADLANCDVLIQVVDAAGSTDIEGQFIGATPSTESAVEAVQAEIEFLEQELDAWIGGLLEDGWNRGVRRVQAEGEKGLTAFVQERLSGLGATSPLVAQGMMNFNDIHSSDAQPWDWDRTSLHLLGRCMREQLFPIVYAANKMDIAPQGVVEAFSNRSMYACMADMELALRRATSAGLIDYRSGQSTFQTVSDAALNDAQEKALNHMQERLQAAGGTGLASLMDEVLFDRLNHMVVYPVQDETHWVDGDGRVLPDALVVPSGLHAKALAGRVHSDLESGFIRGVDGRTRRVVGADHELADGDVLKIHAKT